MKVLKALIFDETGRTPPALCDAIEYQQQLWLVSGWLETPTRAVSKPMRLIPLARLRYQRVPPEDKQPFDLVVNDGLPKQLFAPEIPTELRSKFQVLENPDIEFPAGGGRIQ